MTVSTIIQDRTNDGVTVVDFLLDVMQATLDDFKPCHRLAAAKLLTKYGCCHESALAGRAEGMDFILENPPEPSRPRTSSGSPSVSEFDNALARVIRESTDDGRSVCRFLINVMEGDLSAFKPHHRISAARELLDRGFGKGAREEARSTNSPRRSGVEPVPGLIRERNPEEAGSGGSHSSLLSTHSSPEGENPDYQQVPESEKSPNQTNHSSDEEEIPWDEIWEEIDPMIEEAQRRSAELSSTQPDPDNPPYVPDYSVFDEAMKNSQKWFQEWKNSIEPEECQAIIKETSERFSAKLDARIERRKQIKKDREHRAKEEAEREAQQARARAEVKVKAEAEAKEEEDLGPPPAREDHKRWSPTPSIPTSFRLVNCGHPKCKLHDGPIYYPEDDRSSPYYNPGIPPPSSRTYPF